MDGDATKGSVFHRIFSLVFVRPCLDLCISDLDSFLLLFFRNISSIWKFGIELFSLEVPTSLEFLTKGTKRSFGIINKRCLLFGFCLKYLFGSHCCSLLQRLVLFAFNETNH